MRDSLFQMALPQVKGLAPTRVPVDADGILHVSIGVMVETVVPGDIGPPPLANELLRTGWAAWTSLSQEDRRTGFGVGCEEGGCSCPCFSISSSEDATTSESGVDRLAMRRFFSRRREPLFAPKPAIEARATVVGEDLLAPEAMVERW